MLLPVALNNGGLGSTSDFDSLQSRQNGPKPLRGPFGICWGSIWGLLGGHRGTLGVFLGSIKRFVESYFGGPIRDLLEGSLLSVTIEP